MRGEEGSHACLYRPSVSECSSINASSLWGSSLAQYMSGLANEVLMKSWSSIFGLVLMRYEVLSTLLCHSRVELCCSWWVDMSFVYLEYCHRSFPTSTSCECEVIYDSPTSCVCHSLRMSSRIVNSTALIRLGVLP